MGEQCCDVSGPFPDTLVLDSAVMTVPVPDFVRKIEDGAASEEAPLSVGSGRLTIGEADAPTTLTETGESPFIAPTETNAKPSRT